MSNYNVHPFVVAAYMLLLVFCAVVCVVVTQRSWSSCCIPTGCDPGRVARGDRAMPEGWSGHPMCDFSAYEYTLMDCSEGWGQNVSVVSDNEATYALCYASTFTYWAMWIGLPENLLALFLVLIHICPVIQCFDTSDNSGCGRPGQRIVVVCFLYMCASSVFYLAVMIHAIAQPFALEDVTSNDAIAIFGRPVQKFAMWEPEAQVIVFFAFCLLVHLAIPLGVLVPVVVEECNKSSCCSDVGRPSRSPPPSNGKRRTCNTTRRTWRFRQTGSSGTEPTS